MGYAYESLQEWQSEYVQGTADVLTAAADHNGLFEVTRPITVLAVGAIITTAIQGACVVKFDRRVTKGSDTGRGDGDVGILTIPDGTAVGKQVISDNTRVDLNPGDQVVPEVTSAAATAGGAHYFIHYIPRAETIANLSDYVESTT